MQPGESRSAIAMMLYAITIFLSAFLLFQIQPLIAKTVLPWFGGTSSVWSTCMVFFQTALLGGYLYAHWLHTRFEARKQAIIHCCLLAVSLLVLPIAPDPSWKGSAMAHPVPRILGLLCTSVGLPYFLLSTTGPLLQAWYARTHSGSIPYRLYALSNLASMLALLSYPVLVEPNMTLWSQGIAWSVAFACYILLCGTTAWRASRISVHVESPTEMQNEPSPGWRLRLLWMSLAACASILLLAMTTFLTQDVAAIPFLWILPLAAYLLSFIICFEAPRLYNRTFFLIALVAALAGMARIFATHGEDVRISLMIAITVSSLFVFCMVCHGELVRSKPHTRRLTLFYVMLSTGGALGGVFVGIVAPGLFHAFYEFPIGLGLCAFLAVVVLWDGQRWSSRGVLIAGLFAYAVWLGVIMHQFTSGYRVMERNFYGQIRVRQSGADDDFGPRRTLLHGRIAHGEQVLDEAYSRLPSTYFCPDTGVGRALSNRAAPRRVGILGLGSGTLAVYGRQGDTFRIYEINPQVVEVARTEFTYLRDTSAKVETVLGDGRLMLEREPDQHFDVLVMDAFSGDSVPVHLITLEAFATYLRHMKPDGIVAVNISNKFLNLRPVMERAASRFGKVALAFDFISDGYDALCYDASWVLIMDETVHRAKAKQFTGGEVLEPVKGFRPWTDGFSNMFRILK